MIRIKNWGTFQHYKNRRPPWIRLYRDLLDDPDFEELDGELVKTLIKLWLSVSDFSVDGTLPAIERLALRMHIASTLLASRLVQLKQWLECDDSELLAYCKQVARPEGEQIRADQSRSEGETERESPAPTRGPKQKRSSKKTQLPDEWIPRDSHVVLAKEFGVSVTEEAVKFREHAIATGRTMKNWDMAFNTWIRKAAEYKQSSRTSPDKNVNAMKSWERVLAYCIRRESIELTDLDRRSLRAIGGTEHLRSSKNLSVDCALFCRAFIAFAESDAPQKAPPKSTKKSEPKPAGPTEVREHLEGLVGYRLKDAKK